MTDADQAAGRVQAYLDTREAWAKHWDEPEQIGTPIVTQPRRGLEGPSWLLLTHADLAAVLGDRTRQAERIAELEASSAANWPEACCLHEDKRDDCNWCQIPSPYDEIDRLRAKIAELEAEREQRAAPTAWGSPETIWAIAGLDGYLMTGVSEEAARREAAQYGDRGRVALCAERTAWRKVAPDAATGDET